MERASSLNGIRLGLSSSADDDSHEGQSLVGSESDHDAQHLINCPICVESFPSLLPWADCGHQQCASCTIRLIRNELDVPDESRLACPQPGCGVMLHFDTLRAAAEHRPPQNLASDSAYRPLAPEAIERARRRIATKANADALAAALAAGLNAKPCPACGAAFVCEPSAASVHGIVARLARCGGCSAELCSVCGTAWEGHAAGASCADVMASREAQRAAAAATAPPMEPGDNIDPSAPPVIDDSINMGALIATMKQCPQCNWGFSHYRGHGCHHCFPGNGCPGCPRAGFSRPAHFCYVCLGPWPCIDSVGQGCNTFCDATCDCPGEWRQSTNACCH